MVPAFYTTGVYSSEHETKQEIKNRKQKELAIQKYLPETQMHPSGSHLDMALYHIPGTDSQSDNGSTHGGLSPDSKPWREVSQNGFDGSNESKMGTFDVRGVSIDSDPVGLDSMFSADSNPVVDL